MAQNWYVLQAGQKIGPFDSAHLKAVFRAGRLQADALIANSAEGPWHPLSKVKGLSDQTKPNLVPQTPHTEPPLFKNTANQASSNFVQSDDFSSVLDDELEDGEVEEWIVYDYDSPSKNYSKRLAGHSGYRVSTGYWIVVGGIIGFLAIACIGAFGLGQYPNRHTVRAVTTASIVILIGGLFAGPVWITVVKGHSLILGVALGLISPLGLLISTLLSDRSGKIEFSESATTTQDPLPQPVDSTYYSSFSTYYGVVAWLRLVIGILLGVGQATIMGMSLLSFSGGIPVTKILIACSSGVFTTLAFVGTLTMLSLAFAPRDWLENDPVGKTWIRRTGIGGKNRLVYFRILTLIIGIAALGCLSVVSQGALESLSEFQSPK